MPQVQFGIDHFLNQYDKLSRLRTGLMTNNAATTSSGMMSRIALLKSKFRLIKLFSPEHGLTAQGEDGTFQTNITDVATGLPVISLYGDRLKPLSEDLADVDAILFDIPDVGCRFYTYLWTMTYIMEACAEFNKRLFILDRPNPIGGHFDLTEAPMLDEANCSSFIGRWSIPIRHGYSLGELANYFAATRIKSLDLQIIKAGGWNREPAKDANWFFVPPSPGIPDTETALLYPGMGLLEGINVNEGRGTNDPFKIFGAPWIDADQLHEEFKNLKLPGIITHACSYEPESGLYHKEKCYGLQLKIIDSASFHPVRTGLALIKLIRSLYPERCKERLYKTRANPAGERHLDKLTGIYNSFEWIKSMEMTDRSLDASEWNRLIDPYLLYPDAHI
jgi:uncharacterized protein YbbC (DUF1343 family)